MTGQARSSNAHVFLAALAGAISAIICAGASRALVAMPMALLAAFGAACLALALAQPHHRGRALAAWCAGAAVGLMLPQALPVGPVVTRTSGDPRGSDLFALLDELDAHPQAMLGRRVAVSGTWTPPGGPRRGSVSRRIMACCAADSVDVGLDVVPRADVFIAPGATVCVSGILASALRGGELRYEVELATVRVIDTQASRCIGR